MTLPGLPRPLAAVVQKVMESFDGHASINQIVDGVRNTATHAEWELWSVASVAAGVRSVLRKKGKDGLPAHLSVDGEYFALTLFSVEQFKIAAAAQCRRGGEFYGQARLLEEHCRAIHGQGFDVEVMITESLRAS